MEVKAKAMAKRNENFLWRAPGEIGWDKYVEVSNRLFIIV
jgi:hypothetical protein